MGAQETARDVSTASGACEAFLAQQPGMWCLPTSLHCRVPTPPVRFMRKPRQRPRTWHTLVLCSRVFCLMGRTEPSSRAWLLVTTARGRWAAGRVRGSSSSSLTGLPSPAAPGVCESGTAAGTARGQTCGRPGAGRLAARSLGYGCTCFAFLRAYVRPSWLTNTDFADKPSLTRPAVAVRTWPLCARFPV